jgi:simple sugar transport system ATP-binding protein
MSESDTNGGESTGTAVRLEGITKRFGDVVANDDVDFELEEGSIHALIGENGSGKTTLMSILYGLYEQDSGEVVIRGTHRSFDSPRDAIDAGVGMIHQHFQLVEPMTVLQNVILGQEPTNRGLVDEERARATIEEICNRHGFDVDDHLETPVQDLDMGVRQRVEIVKSLYRGADILVLDDPTAVLTPQEVEGLFDLMNDLAREGTSLIFITHKLEEAMTIADRITVLRDGETVGTVDATDASREQLAEMMVGREVLFDYEKRSDPPDDVALGVSGLHVSDDRSLPAVDDVDFRVNRGEIFGIAGVQGNGQAELVEALTGLREVDAGNVRFEGEDITHLGRREAIESGIAFIPEDRHEEGLVLDYDLVRNSLLGFQTIEPFLKGRFLDWDAIRDHAGEIIHTYDVQPPDSTKLAGSFAGGNHQKFVVGR